MIKYTGAITFKIDIEAINRVAAEKIAIQALPTHFLFMDGEGGSGRFLRGLTHVVYDQKDTVPCINTVSYWRNR